jgi:hypothetical protein
MQTAEVKENSMYYTLKIPALLWDDLSLRHQFTYTKPDEENGQEYKDLYAVIEVKNEKARIVADGFHSKRKADDYISFLSLLGKKRTEETV